jgi:cell division protein FtsN
MRQGRGRWRIFAIDRDGEPVLLTPPEREALHAALDGDGTAGNGNEPPQEGEVAAAEVVPEAHLAALVDESSELLRVRPAPRPRSGRQSPFIRRLDDGTWTVQVGATVDAIEADLERQWYESSGEPAFVQTAEVSGRVWQRVLIGRYPARADAMQTLARLTDAGAEVSARR